MSKLVVKIGGSFLTKKGLSDAFPTTIGEIRNRRGRFIEMHRLNSISREIHAISSEHEMMVVHGAGPFGHALVERILSGNSIDPALVHESMLVLNSEVSTQLSRLGFECETTSPFDEVLFDGQYLTTRLVSKMKGDGTSGKLPLSHGDLVPTRAGKGRVGAYEVISGDVVARDLAVGWPAERVIMVTDVDGILDRDPALAAGDRIPRIGYNDCLDLLRDREGKGADVTGGIAYKIISCKASISMGMPLQIISGIKKGQLVAASEGADVGTTIEMR